MSILRHSEQLGNLGISLHSRIVESLVIQIEDAISEGLIRCTEPDRDRRQLFSVLDFIREILGQKSERKVWQRLTESDPHTVAFCHSVKFNRTDGKKANTESPATDLTGLLYIAYMASGTFSEKLRAASAAYFAADRKPVATPVQVAAEVEYLTLNHVYTDYPRNLAELHQVSGIKSRYYVASAVKRDFELGIDYIEADGELLLTEDAFNWLVVSFRSQRGTDTAKLPENIPLTRRGFKLSVNRKNARIGCAAGGQAEARPQVVRSHNVKPASLANLLPNCPKYGAGIQTTPIRVPVELVDKVRAFIAESL